VSILGPRDGDRDLMGRSGLLRIVQVLSTWICLRSDRAANPDAGIHSIDGLGDGLRRRLQEERAAVGVHPLWVWGTGQPL